VRGDDVASSRARPDLERIFKDVTAAQLVAGVRVVASGDSMLAPTVTQRLLERFSAALPAAANGHRRSPLR
jgi:DNA-binding NarL/FixJ family response regulator